MSRQNFSVHINQTCMLQSELFRKECLLNITVNWHVNYSRQIQALLAFSLPFNFKELSSSITKPQNGGTSNIHVENKRYSASSLESRKLRIQNTVTKYTIFSEVFLVHVSNFHVNVIIIYLQNHFMVQRLLLWLWIPELRYFKSRIQPCLNKETRN